MRMARPLILIVFGGLAYTGIELFYRGHTHWTMFIVGGICFYLVGLINEIIPWEVPLWRQCSIGACIITGVEFISGCIINLMLGWDVWDYSDMPLNIMGQICLPFSVLWFVISALAIIIDDYLRYAMGGEKPYYTIFRHKKQASCKAGHSRDKPEKVRNS